MPRRSKPAEQPKKRKRPTKAFKRDEAVVNSFLRFLRERINGFKAEPEDVQTGIAWLMWDCENKSREHETLSGYRSITYPELERRFGRNEFNAIYVVSDCADATQPEPVTVNAEFGDNVCIDNVYTEPTLDAPEYAGTTREVTGEVAPGSTVTVTYTAQDGGALPVSKYKSTITVKPADGGGSTVEWKGVFFRADASEHPAAGKDDEAATGTIKLKATFQNSDRTLWPGQFVRVVLELERRMNTMVAPSQAVQSSQDGTFLYIVKEDRTVEVRPVTVGARLDQDVVIESGVTAGESVVTEGTLRLVPGARVSIREPGSGGRSSGASPALQVA